MKGLDFNGKQVQKDSILSGVLYKKQYISQVCQLLEV